MRLQLDGLPAHLHEGAFAVGNGELLWKRNEALEIAELAPKLDLAVLGGEIYEARAGFGWATYLRSWDTPDSGLAWPDFADHAAGQAIREIESEFPEQMTPEARVRRAELLYFFLAVCSRAEYDEGAPAVARPGLERPR